MLFIFSGFIVFGKGFITIWAGKNYSESYIITLIFFGSLFIPLIQNTGITILQARNQMKFRSILYLAISVVSLGFQIYLSKEMGPIGCAIAIGGALIIGQGIVMNIYYQAYQHIAIGIFWKEIIKMIPIPVFFTIGGIILNNYFDYSKLGVLASGVAIYTILYFVLFFQFGMNQYEKNLLRNPIKKILKHRT